MIYCYISGFPVDSKLLVEPLSLIDPKADFDKILSVANIGDAFKILTPDMIGKNLLFNFMLYFVKGTPFFYLK